MNRMCIRNLILLSVLAATGWITGCAGRNVSILVTRPAEINLSEYDLITIGEIKGAGSGFVSKLDDLGKFLQGVESGDAWIRRFAAETSQALARTDRFRLLDYERLKAGRSREDDNANVILISGGLLAYDYDEEEINEDVKKKNRKTDKGNTAREYKRKGTARVEVQLRVVDWRTSEILASRNFSRRETIRTSGKTPEKASIDNAARRRLFAECRADIVRAIERMIVPYSERVNVSFETAKEMPELEHGFRLVQAGNWDSAVDVFLAAVETYSDLPEVHKAYYNLGLSCMYTDQFDRARTALQQANARKSSGIYRNAILELDRRMEEKRRLDEQTRTDRGTGEDDAETVEDQ
ncbi:MAG: hypothetical protein OXU79_17545 [Gemmatimonadota bacterium]|nr:hypothetical protein [Gemmatimonadota bacterium]